MVQIRKSPSDNVDAMLRNAELRSELERYYDETIEDLTHRRLPLDQENKYLEMMLAWESAPILPIFEWFDPPLRPRCVGSMTDHELTEELWTLIRMLYEKQIVLDFTDHLSDMELYEMICYEILPAREKMLAMRDGFLHWDCANVNENQMVWLTYYASDEDREAWEELNDMPLPARRTPPFPRDIPTD